MSYANAIAFPLEAGPRARRLPLLHFLEAAGTDPLPASAAATVASLLGVYSDAESADRAVRSGPALPLPSASAQAASAQAASVQPAAVQTAHAAQRGRRQLSPTRRRHDGAAERAQRLRHRGRRLEPAKGVRSQYQRGPLPARPFFTRRSRKHG